MKPSLKNTEEISLKLLMMFHQVNYHEKVIGSFCGPVESYYSHNYLRFPLSWIWWLLSGFMFSVKFSHETNMKNTKEISLKLLILFC
jgi:hypothetical protein